MNERLDREHTPGPWELCGVMNGDAVYIIKGGLKDASPEFARSVAINGGEGCIATLRLPHAGMMEIIKGESEQGANARLMAAAPDLLVALKRWEEYARDNNYSDEGCTFLQQTRAAIAKAEGSQ